MDIDHHHGQRNRQLDTGEEAWSHKLPRHCRYCGHTLPFGIHSIKRLYSPSLAGRGHASAPGVTVVLTSSTSTLVNSTLAKRFQDSGVVDVRSMRVSLRIHRACVMGRIPHTRKVTDLSSLFFLHENCLWLALPNCSAKRYQSDHRSIGKQPQGGIES